MNRRLVVLSRRLRLQYLVIQNQFNWKVRRPPCLPLAVRGMSNLVLIKKFQNTVEAEIAKGFLEEQGIHATVSAADAGGTVSGFAAWSAGEGALYVLDNDADNALALLESVGHGEAAADSEDSDI